MKTMSASRVDTYINVWRNIMKRSTIGNHVKYKHGKDPESIERNFRILKKCQSKLDCLIIFLKCFLFVNLNQN